MDRRGRADAEAARVAQVRDRNRPGVTAITALDTAAVAVRNLLADLKDEFGIDADLPDVGEVRELLQERLDEEGEGEDEDSGSVRERAEEIARILTGLYGAAVAEHFSRRSRILFYARFDPLQHPRGANGRFIQRGSVAAVGAAKDVIGKVIRREAHAHTPKEVLEHLNLLTLSQLREVSAEQGVKVPTALKGELVDMIAELMSGKGDKTVSGPATPGESRTVKTSDLHADPSRFQYKISGINKSGVTEELKGIGKFNPELAGVVAVWKDSADGKDYVVNGHHRFELAERAGHGELLVRYLDARNAKEARAKGAIINIAEGRGTALDAAKFLRDTGRSIEDLKAEGVSVSGRIANDAGALSNLNDRLFSKLATGEMDEPTALAIGRHLKDHDQQNLLAKIIEKEEDKKKPLAARDIEEMAREMSETPTTTRTEESLFGTDTYEESLFVERAELKSHVRAELAKEVNDWAAVASKRRAGRVAEGGNVLDVEANKEQQQLADQAKNVFGTLVNRKGPISDSINAAAAEYAAAKTKKQREAIKKQALEGVRDAVKRELGFGGEEKPAADAGRGVASAVPRGEGVHGGEPRAKPGQGTADGGGAKTAGVGVKQAAHYTRDEQDPPREHAPKGSSTGGQFVSTGARSTALAETKKATRAVEPRKARAEQRGVAKHEPSDSGMSLTEALSVAEEIASVVGQVAASRRALLLAKGVARILGRATGGIEDAYKAVRAIIKRQRIKSRAGFENYMAARHPEILKDAGALQLAEDVLAGRTPSAAGADFMDFTLTQLQKLTAEKGLTAGTKNRDELVKQLVDAEVTAPGADQYVPPPTKQMAALRRRKEPPSFDELMEAADIYGRDRVILKETLNGKTLNEIRALPEVLNADGSEMKEGSVGQVIAKARGKLGLNKEQWKAKIAQSRAIDRSLDDIQDSTEPDEWGQRAKLAAPFKELHTDPDEATRQIDTRFGAVRDVNKQLDKLQDKYAKIMERRPLAPKEQDEYLAEYLQLADRAEG